MLLAPSMLLGVVVAFSRLPAEGFLTKAGTAFVLGSFAYAMLRFATAPFFGKNK